MKKRLTYFTELAVRGELIRESDWWWKEQSHFHLYGHGLEGDPQPELVPKPVNLVRVGQGKTWPSGGLYDGDNNNINGECLGRVGWPGLFLSEWGKAARTYCCLDDTIASYHVTINPQDASDLALLLDCKIKDLPWQLQVWTSKRIDYHGNPNLNRLDPAEWKLKNPWVGDTHNDGQGGLKLSLGLSLSKRAVARIRKKLGMPPIQWMDFRPKKKSQRW